MSYEIAKMLVASTSNISRETADMLTNPWPHADVLPVVFDKGEYGWFVNVPAYDGDADYDDDGNLRAGSSHGSIDALYPAMPADLRALLAVAEEQECQWVMLDRDGDEVEGLEVFEW